MRREFLQQGGNVLLPVVKSEGDARGDVGADHFLNVLFGDAALLEQRAHLAEELLAARHLDVLAALDHLLRVVHRRPVAHHAAPESQLAAQDAPDQVGVLPGPLAVEAVVGGHHVTHASVDAGLERRQVEFVQRPFVDDRVRAAAVKFRLVADEVFQTRHGSRRLHALHILGDHRRGEQRIFAHVFEVASVLRVAVDVHARTQQDFDASGAALFAHGFGITIGQRRVEGRCEGDRARKGRRTLQLADHRRVGQVVAHVHALRGVGEIDVGHAFLGHAVEEERGVAAHERDLLVEGQLCDPGVGLPVGLVPRYDLLGGGRCDRRGCRCEGEQKFYGGFHRFLNWFAFLSSAKLAHERPAGTALRKNINDMNCQFSENQLIDASDGVELYK